MFMSARWYLQVPFILSVLILAVWAVWASGVRAESKHGGWTRFRGPNGTGVAETGDLPVPSIYSSGRPKLD